MNMQTDTSTPLQTFPGRLRKCIELIGTGTLAAKEIGISRNTLETYLTGQVDPKIGIVEKLSALSGVSCHWLITGNGDMMLNKKVVHEASLEPSWEPDFDVLRKAISITQRVLQDKQARAAADQFSAICVLIYKQAVRGVTDGELMEIAKDVSELLPRNENVSHDLSDEEALLNLYRHAAPMRRLLLMQFAKGESVPSQEPSSAASTEK